MSHHHPPEQPHSTHTTQQHHPAEHTHNTNQHYGRLPGSFLFQWRNYIFTTRHLAVGMGTCLWFWVFYKLKKDGGHLLGHHSWEH